MTVDFVGKQTQEEVRQEVRQIIQECKWTDKLQRLVDYGAVFMVGQRMLFFIKTYLQMSLIP